MADNVEYDPLGVPVEEIDVLALLPLIQSVAYGAPIPPDHPINLVTATSFALLAQAAFNQNRKKIRRDLKKHQATIDRIFGGAATEQVFLHGAWISTEAHHAEGFLTEERFNFCCAIIGEKLEGSRRQAAHECAIFLEDLQKKLDSKGNIGRPKQSKGSDAFLNFVDARVLSDALRAAKTAAVSRHVSSEAILKHLRNVIKDHLRYGSLPLRGTSFQEAVDIHYQRLRRHHMSLIEQERSLKETVQMFT